MSSDVGSVAVVGIGRMGGTIAAFLISQGVDCTLLSSRSPESVKAQLAGRLGMSCRGDVEAVRLKESLDHLLVVSRPRELKAIDLVIECLPEDIGIKQRFFDVLDSEVDEKVVFASNTSSLMIRELAGVTTRSDRFLGLHFFNPADRMELVELAAVSETSASVVSRVKAFLEGLGKRVVVVDDTPGFVVNRALFAMVVEAMRIYEVSEISASDVDEAMRLGTGMPLGPLEMADFIGLDVCSQVLRSLSSSYGDRFKPPESLEDMLSQGMLGRKSGQGFKQYGEGK